MRPPPHDPTRYRIGEYGYNTVVIRLHMVTTQRKVILLCSDDLNNSF